VQVAQVSHREVVQEGLVEQNQLALEQRVVVEEEQRQAVVVEVAVDSLTHHHLEALVSQAQTRREIMVVRVEKVGLAEQRVCLGEVQVEVAEVAEVTILATEEPEVTEVLDPKGTGHRVEVVEAMEETVEQTVAQVAEAEMEAILADMEAMEEAVILPVDMEVTADLVVGVRAVPEGVMVETVGMPREAEAEMVATVGQRTTSELRMEEMGAMAETVFRVVMVDKEAV